MRRQAGRGIVSGPARRTSTPGAPEPTKKVYRHLLRPMLRMGAEIMDGLFGVPPGDAEAA
jgi:hypothetical protein